MPSLGVRQEQNTDSYRKKSSSESVHLNTEPNHKPSRNPCCDYEDTAPTHTVDTDPTTLLMAFNTDLTGKI